jgi:TusE/DsrC/DsvC family sulfur relay protein
MFSHAPSDWSQDEARSIANEEGLAMEDDHWQVVSALQEYCSRHDCNKYSVRELHDALDERFHAKGGYKYLYKLFPGGPIAQGCKLAGLEPPAGAIDKGFGSVV